MLYAGGIPREYIVCNGSYAPSWNASDLFDGNRSGYIEGTLMMQGPASVEPHSANISSALLLRKNLQERLNATSIEQICAAIKQDSSSAINRQAGDRKTIPLQHPTAPTAAPSGQVVPSLHPAVVASLPFTLPWCLNQSTHSHVRLVVPPLERCSPRTHFILPGGLPLPLGLEPLFFPPTVTISTHRELSQVR